MVDMKLAKEVRKLTAKSKMKEDPKNFLKLFELTKQLAVTDEDLKEALEINKIVGQILITDKNLAFWFSAGDGVFDYGEGEADNPSYTMKATWEIIGKILSMESDGQDEYLSGELVIEGNIQDAINYAEITRAFVEALQKL
jgi:hypothetical protein